MNSKQLVILIAAIVAVAYVLGVSLYFPLDFWNAARLFAAAMIPASIALFAYLSLGYSTDVNLALAGIGGFLCTVQLLAAIRIFTFATGEENSMTAVLCIANLAFGAVIAVMVKMAAKIVSENIERNDSGSEYSRIARDLTLWANQTDEPGTREALLVLSEELRYYPRRIGQNFPLPADVTSRLAALSQAIQARGWNDATAAVGELRRSLEASRLCLLSNYTKA